MIAKAPMTSNVSAREQGAGSFGVSLHPVAGRFGQLTDWAIGAGAVPQFASFIQPCCDCRFHGVRSARAYDLTPITISFFGVDHDRHSF